MEPAWTTVGLPSPAVGPLVARLFLPAAPEPDGPEPLERVLAFAEGGRPIGRGAAHALISELFRHSSHGRGRRFTAEERQTIADALDQSVRALRTLGLSDLQVVREGHQSLMGRLSRTGGAGRAALSAKGMRVWEALLTAVCVHVVDRLARRSPLVAREARRQARAHAELIGRSDERLLAESVRLADADQEFELGHLGALGERYRTVSVLGLADVSPGAATRWLEHVHVPLAAVTGDGGPPRPAHRLPERHPRLLLRGGPGAGKTVLAHWLAARAAADRDTGRIPFLVPLRLLGAQEAMPETVEEFLATAPGLPLERLHDGWIDRVLAEGRGLVVVDGLDEVHTAVRAAVGRRLAELLAVYPGTRCVVLTRPRAVRDGWLARHGFTEATLLPLTPDGVSELVRRWCADDRGDGGGAREDGGGSGTGADSGAGPGAALNGLLRSRPGLADAATNPLICAALCALTAEHGLLTEHDCLSGVLPMLFGGRDGRRGVRPPGGAPPGRDLCYEAAQSVARATVLEGSPELPTRTVLRLFTEHDEHGAPGGQDPPHGREPFGDPRRLLAHLVDRTGVLSTGPADTVAFTHPVFRDFLLARRIARWNDRELLVRQVGSADLYPVVSLLTEGQENGDISFLIDGPGHDRPPLPAGEPTEGTAGEPRSAPAPAASRAEPDTPPTVARPPAAPPPPARAPVRPSGPTRGAHELAMALSVATRVEPELIRAVRVRLFPWLDVGDESDLWFGPWTATRTRAAIALRPDLLPALRAELADRLHRSPPDDPLRSLGALVAEVHSALPPALRLEERVTWIDVSVRSGRQKTLERALEPALRALLTEGRDGLADWLAGAWPRLPEAVRSTVTAWQLANLAAHRAPDHGPPVPEPPGGLTPGHVAVLAEAVPHVALPVSLSGPRLRLGAPAATGGAAILVPDTDPRVIEILSPGGGPARTVLVERDGEHTVEIGTGPGPVRLRTPTGAVYELVPERAPTRPAPLPERGTVAELLVLLDPGTQPGVPRRAVEELRALLELLGDAGLPEVQVLRQFRLPDTGTRVDAVIAGMRPGGREPSYAVVELRRWRHGEVDRRMERDATARVRRSVDHLTRRLALLRDSPELIDGFVHWYRTDPAERAATGSGRLFPDVSRDRALELLRERFAPLPGAPAVDALLDSDTVPEDPAQFVLRPDQEEGYGAVLRRVERAREAHPQEVIIVTGGPGSGRSAVGLALLRELRRRSEEVYYTNGSPALEHLLSSVGLLDGVRKHPAERAGFGGEADGTGFLLYDEAQCLRGPFAPRPVSRFDQRLRRGQVDRMIRAARVPVFLLDEEDTGHPGEVGSFVSIASAATDQGRTVREIDLDAFGAGAGWGHAQWVSRLLGLRAEPVGRYPSDSTPALLLAESPRRLEEAVRARTAEGGTARLTAGSAWPWYAPESEVRIGDWARPWGHRLIDSDPSAAHPLERVERVQDVRGCAFDWCGVLMGPDLVWREGRWVTDLDASHDPRMRSLPPEEAARCVVRLYRTLLTRGLHGTVLHSTDEETRARLAELIPRV